MHHNTTALRRACELHDVAITAWLADTAGEDAASERYVDASRAALAPDPAPPSAYRRPARWICVLLELERFTIEQGRSPRENSSRRDTVPERERHLGEWCRYQRRHWASLTAFQRARLDVSPAFAWDIREQAWQERADEIDAFIGARGRRPMLRAADAEEFVLARWMARQLAHLQRGTLPPSRAARMDELLTGH